jgi:DNA-binding SARP family transcriptional activator
VARDVLAIVHDTTTADLVRRALPSDSCTLDVARGGDAGLAQLRARHYRLLVLSLPDDESGLEVLHALRSEPGVRPPAIMILASPGQHIEVAGALTAGADDYLITGQSETAPIDLGLRITLWLRRTAFGAPRGRPGLRIRTLGTFSVENGGRLRLQDGGRARKASVLLKYLLTNQERVIPTAEVLALLWPSTLPDLAATDLRSLLSYLRRLLGLFTGSSAQLEHTRSTVALHLDPTAWWDVAEFRGWLQQGSYWEAAGQPERALGAYARAVALYAGDYLEEDGDAAWVVPHRARLRADWLHALSTMATLHGRLGQTREQEPILRLVLDAALFDEPAYRIFMRLLAAQGRGAEALLLYRQLEQHLHANLGIAPDPATQAEAARIRYSGSGRGRATTGD